MLKKNKKIKKNGDNKVKFKFENIFHFISNEFVVIISGGNGYINDYPTGRLLRDAKLYEIGAGTSEVRRLIIGRAINAFYK